MKIGETKVIDQREQGSMSGGCWQEFLDDPENFEMVQSYCGPWTRLCMLHFYGAMRALRKKTALENKSLPKSFPRDLPPNLKGAVVEATFRKNVLPYPAGKPPPLGPRPVHLPKTKTV